MIVYKSFRRECETRSCFEQRTCHQMIKNLHVNLLCACFCVHWFPDWEQLVSAFFSEELWSLQCHFISFCVANLEPKRATPLASCGSMSWAKWAWNRWPRNALYSATGGIVLQVPCNWQSLPWDRRLEVQNDRLFRCVMACWVDSSCESNMKRGFRWQKSSRHQMHITIIDSYKSFKSVTRFFDKHPREVERNSGWNKIQWNEMEHIPHVQGFIQKPFEEWGGQKPYHDYFA